MMLGKVHLSNIGTLKLNPVFHHLSSAIPEQLCLFAHHGCTCREGTSYYMIFHLERSDIFFCLTSFMFWRINTLPVLYRVGIMFRYGKTEAVLRLFLRLFWKFEKIIIIFRYLRAFFNKTIFRMLWHSLLKMAAMHLRSGLKNALFSQWLAPNFKV